ncbi:HD domain-containing protein [Micromonospora sp. NPDC051006]|uniref:HD domain-containing protein n=1 Tax=Micromonospora sp. NPDC051006 TaxID=3364283 RepID=UPI00378A776E
MQEMSVLVQQAAAIAEDLLREALPRRWRHVRAVGLKAEALGVLPNVDVEILSASAWLHDIGYSPRISDTGFHALDGARWLLREGFSMRLASLVAHHSFGSHPTHQQPIEH